MTPNTFNHALVIAPHPDDELIGLYGELFHGRTLLTPRCAITVANLHQGSSHRNPTRSQHQRNVEMIASARRHNFALKTCSLDELLPDLGMDLIQSNPTWDRIYLPSRTDRHPEHLEVTNRVMAYVNNESSASRLRFYCVDMNLLEAAPLPEPVANAKLEALRACYPSQGLYEKNEAYWRFECVLPSDILTTFTVSGEEVNGNKDFTVTVSSYSMPSKDLAKSLLSHFRSALPIGYAAPSFLELEQALATFCVRNPGVSQWRIDIRDETYPGFTLTRSFQ